jgi:hypothetical protein
MMGELDLAPRQEARAHKAPAKRWRNKWRHTKDVVFDSGFRSGPSEHLGPSVFPTHEVAEQKAHDWMAECADIVELCGVEYLGPAPDPDAP